MARFEFSSAGIIEVDGIRRPDLSLWSDGLPSNDATKLGEIVTDVIHSDRSLVPICQTLVQYASFIEPCDAESVIDRFQKRADAFKKGIYLGIACLAPLFGEYPHLAGATLFYLNQTMIPQLLEIRHHDPAQRAELRIAWLEQQSSLGRSRFEDVEPALDRIATAMRLSLDDQLVIKVGAGIVENAVWESLRTTEHEFMEFLADGFKDSPDEVDNELQEILTNG